MAGAGERDDEVLICSFDPDRDGVYTSRSQGALHVWRLADTFALG